MNNFGHNDTTNYKIGSGKNCRTQLAISTIFNMAAHGCGVGRYDGVTLGRLAGVDEEELAEAVRTYPISYDKRRVDALLASGRTHSFPLTNFPLVVVDDAFVEETN